MVTFSLALVLITLIFKGQGSLEINLGHFMITGIIDFFIFLAIFGGN